MEKVVENKYKKNNGSEKGGGQNAALGRGNWGYIQALGQKELRPLLHLGGAFQCILEATFQWISEPAFQCIPEAAFQCISVGHAGTKTSHS
jgi:hypothetical protein